MQQDPEVSLKQIGTRAALVVNVHGSIESWQGFGRVTKIIESSMQKFFLVSIKNVDCINCAGIAKMMAMTFIAKELGKEVCFAGMQPCVRRVFESLTGHEFVSVYGSEEDPLAAH